MGKPERGTFTRFRFFNDDPVNTPTVDLFLKLIGASYPSNPTSSFPNVPQTSPIDQPYNTRNVDGAKVTIQQGGKSVTLFVEDPDLVELECHSEIHNGVIRATVTSNP